MPLVSVSHVSPSVEERLQDGGVSACGLGCLVWLVLGSSFLSPPSDCSSLPSTMTWAPCPHGVRTRGKKKAHSGQGPLSNRDPASGPIATADPDRHHYHLVCAAIGSKLDMLQQSLHITHIRVWKILHVGWVVVNTTTNAAFWIRFAEPRGSSG